jgi:hypothetical protein
MDDDLYRLHRIQNPAHKIAQYLFDDGWQSVAEDVNEEIHVHDK